MIYDNIHNRSSYKENLLLSRILDTMAEQIAQPMPGTAIAIDGGDAFINPVSFVTKPEADCLYEAHKRYADIHFILEGEEKIVVQRPELLCVHTPYDTSKDIGFFEGSGGVAVVLQPGDFLVCFPQDAHKVAICTDQPAAVKKLVGKLIVRAD